MTNPSNPPQRSTWPVVLGLVAVQVFFGIHYIAAKSIVDDMPPRSYAVLRIWGAALLVFMLVRLLGRKIPSRPRDVGLLALYALFGVVLNQTLFAEGISRTTPIHAALINTTIPLSTLTLAVLLGREKIAWRRALALLIGLVGAVLVIWPDPDALGGATVLGDGLITGNAVSFSLFLALSRDLFRRVDSLGATAVLLLWGVVGITIGGASEVASTDFTSVSALNWGWIGFAIIFPTAGAYFLQSWALSRVDSSIVAFFIYLQPVIAAALSIAIYKERPGVNVWAGATLIFVAVLITQLRALRRRGPKRRESPPERVASVEH